MTEALRKSGIGTVGKIAWGTHFCHFYQNKRDLVDVLIPYFMAGLEQNEFCVWGVFDPLDKPQARKALERAFTGANRRFAAGSIEVVPQSRWCRGDDVHILQELVRDWEAKFDKALAKGYDGMRVGVSPAWLAERNRQDLDAYEAELSAFVAKRRVILLCAYPLAVNRANEILDSMHPHRFAIARGHGNWQVVEPPELRRARAEVKRLQSERERRAIVLTRKLEQALRASRERALCYFELGLVGMAILSPAKEFIEVNDRFCDILEYERRELMQLTWAALIHPDDQVESGRDYERILTGGVDGYLAPRRLIRKNGDVVHTTMAVKCQRRADGSVDYLAAMIEEVAGLDQYPAADLAAASLVGRLPGHDDLSRREREVARLVGQGRTVKEIAAALELSEQTISTYRVRVLKKLKLKTTTELIHYALKNRLAE